jgi:5-methylcytosine-specific restriction endonuclease McrA
MEPISREAAKTAGLSTYFTGTPCPRGHISTRRVKNHSCTSCNSEKATERYRALPRDHPKVLKTREKARQWAKDHPEEARKRVTEWHKANADHRRTYRRAHRQKEQEAERQRAKDDPGYHRRKHERRKKSDPHYAEKARKRTKEYHAKHPERRKAAWEKWRRENPEKVREIRAAQGIARRAAGTVGVKALREIRARGICAACGQTHRFMEIDHIVAVSKGGRSAMSNLQLLCRPCNRAKWTHDFETWLSG